MRGEGQKAIILMVREEFLREIDAAFPEYGYSDRASFIREAVYELLDKLGRKVSPIIKTPLSHGGRKKSPRPGPGLANQNNVSAGDGALIAIGNNIQQTVTSPKRRKH